MKSFWLEWRGFLLFIILMVFFRSVIADWNTVPTGSMKPTIVEGDRIWVNKLAYDVKIPWTNIGLYQLGSPERGDIVVFNSPTDGTRLVKRLIGMPGDIVSLRNNVLFINDQQVHYQAITQTSNTAAQLIESLNDKQPHTIQLVAPWPHTMSSFGSVRIPDNHYWMMGDNRDESADSRVFGYVAHKYLIGKVESVVVSLNPSNYYLPRKDRILQTLH